MAKKDKEQSDRFKKKAQELGVDESEVGFKKSFDNIVKPKRLDPPNRKEVFKTEG